MSFIDAIKGSILNQFDTSLTATDVLLSLLTATVISILIIFLYQKTFTGVVYSRGTILTILLLALATSMIIRTINSNLALSLGMVGALSIVRFRTAIKDPVDTAFLFWAVTAGIMSGAGLYLIAIIGSLGIAVIYYIFYLTGIKSKTSYLLILNFRTEYEEKAMEIIGGLDKKKLKSKSYSGDYTELSYQVSEGGKLDEVMKVFKDEIEGANVNLVSYSNEYGL